jgi:hypothetical protein
VEKIGAGWVAVGLGLAAIEITAWVWLVAAPQGPDLMAPKAALAISSAPEFNRSRGIDRVLTVVRGSKSMSNAYFVDFEFHNIDSAKHVKARAVFRWGDGWYLQQFFYGQPPNVETVWVDKIN